MRKRSAIPGDIAGQPRFYADIVRCLLYATLALMVAQGVVLVFATALRTEMIWKPAISVAPLPVYGALLLSAAALWSIRFLGGSVAFGIAGLGLGVGVNGFIATTDLTEAVQSGQGWLGAAVWGYIAFSMALFLYIAIRVHDQEA